MKVYCTCSNSPVISENKAPQNNHFNLLKGNKRKHNNNYTRTIHFKVKVNRMT